MKKLLILLAVFFSISFSAYGGEWKAIYRSGSDCFELFEDGRAKVYHDEKLYDEYMYEYMHGDLERATAYDEIKFKSIHGNGQVNILLVVDPVTDGWFVTKVNDKDYLTPLHFVKVNTVRPFVNHPKIDSIYGLYTNNSEYSFLSNINEDGIRIWAIKDEKENVALGSMRQLKSKPEDPSDTLRVELVDVKNEVRAEYFLKIRTDKSLYFEPVLESKTIIGMSECFRVFDFDTMERARRLFKEAE